eukprot:TRINITY_DN8386_c0_g1_i1.p1 TRINITY_DN8386_c0_g1~~TRINITY_DN8386_c0_g1_i1.p1  ORF type:complete len:575 (-),score=25.64 TRINITY_DN8386_c0_g1_i1:527-2221(-)
MGTDYVQRKHAKNRRKKAAKEAGGVKKKEKKGKTPRKLKGMCYGDPFLTKQDLAWRGDNEEQLAKMHRKKMESKGIKRKREEDNQQKLENNSKNQIYVKMPPGCQLPEDESVKVVKPLIGSAQIEVPNLQRYDSKIIRYMQQMRYIEATEVQAFCWETDRLQRTNNLVIQSPHKSGVTTAYILAMSVMGVKNYGIITQNNDTVQYVLSSSKQVAKIAGTKLQACNQTINEIKDGDYRQIEAGNQKTDSEAVVGTLDDFLHGQPSKQLEYLIFDNLSISQMQFFESQFYQLKAKFNSSRFWFFVNDTRDCQFVQQLDVQSHFTVKQISSTQIGKWVKQQVTVCAQHKKVSKLVSLLKSIYFTSGLIMNDDGKYVPNQQVKDQLRCIILVKDIATVRLVAKCVRQLKIKVTFLHGKRTREEKNKAITNFKQSRTPIMVATGKAYHACCALHSVKIPYLINYDFPTRLEDYVWRVGLTGPLSSFGSSTSFFTRDLAQISRSLIKFLQSCNQPIDDALLQLSDAYDLAMKAKQSKQDKMLKLKEKISKKKWLISKIVKYQLNFKDSGQ